MTTMLSVLFLALTLAVAMATTSLSLDFTNAHQMSTSRSTQEEYLLPHRNLFHLSIKEYSLWFESCKVFPENDGSTSQFVLYHLCDYGKPDSCIENQYIVTLEEYILETLRYQESIQSKFCRNCKPCLHSPDKSGCNSKCETCLYNEEMEENGYIDATKFARCQMVYDPFDNNDLDPLYAGPLCSGEEDGSKITIGVFRDEDCTIPDPTKYVEDYLRDENGYGIKLEYALLRSIYENYDNFMDCWDITFENWGSCEKDGISCKDPMTNETKELCESLFLQAGRCEFHPATNTTEEAVTCIQSHEKDLKNNNNIGRVPIYTFSVTGSLAILIGIFGIVTMLVRSKFSTKGPPTNYELVPIEGITTNLQEK